MPPRSVGERLSGLEATVAGFEKYTHDKWHDLANTLQPLTLLPPQMARDFAKLEGSIDRTVAAAVEKAVAPIIADVAELRLKVEAHDQVIQQQAGAKNLAVWFLQSPLIGWLVAAGLVVAAWWKGPK